MEALLAKILGVVGQIPPRGLTDEHYIEWWSNYAHSLEQLLRDTYKEAQRSNKVIDELINRAAERIARANERG